jgi:hypothetical protein
MTLAKRTPKLVSASWSWPQVEVKEYTDPDPTGQPASAGAPGELLVE